MKLAVIYIEMTCLFLLGCQTNDRLEFALENAGRNRMELEKVLEHYKGDERKYKAACFLIENMVGHRGPDSTAVRRLQPFYEKYVKISEKYDWERSVEWQTAIDSVWKYNGQYHSMAPLHNDCQTVRADWLIREIDRSFQAWEENAYTQNASFDDFCRYILPYRYAETTCLDSSREVFYRRHRHLFNDSGKDFRQIIDSLHKDYGYLMHNNQAAASMPIYNAFVFEQVRRGSCDDKAWYNCLQLSALGMPTAIDFTPAWGNRLNAHSWNCVIINGETFPFEPFHDFDRWKYKRIYNNEGFDIIWGKLRLPKVYRHTYELHLEGPFIDKDEKRENIPSLFLNPFIEDVSDAYFKTTDVSIQLTRQVPQGTHYCYLCVFGSREWYPVQWGKIQKDGSVKFQKMGRNMLYWPMFCQNGTHIPAAEPFLLTDKGLQYMDVHPQEKEAIHVRTYTSYCLPYERSRSKRLLSGTYILGSRTAEFSRKDTLFYLTDSMDYWDNNLTLSKPEQYRYIRLVNPKDTFALCEISFFKQGEESPIRDIKVSTNRESVEAFETPDMIVDGLSASGWYGVKKGGGFVDLDLGKEYTIDRLFYAPHITTYFRPDKDLTLCYWDEGSWKVASSKRWDKNFLTFQNVPKGAIYRVRCDGTDDRPFLYEDGMVKWY